MAAARTHAPPVVLAHDDGVALFEDRRQLAPEPASAGAARRVIREALGAAGQSALVGVAELLVSEVVTNATLHAHTPIDLWLAVFDDRLCVEVRDWNPTMPIQRDYDLQATTGRGMGLVSVLAESCGVHSLGEDGKVVWFCVTDRLPEAHVDEWDMGELMDDSASEADGTSDVVLASMPLTLWLSARQHHDAILRELVLYLAEHPATDADMAAADAARSLVSTAAIAAIEAAHAEGRAEPAVPGQHASPLPWVPKQVDLRLVVPAGGAGLFASLQDVLDTAERLAVAGQLLMTPGLPEIIAVRDWVCEQVIAQLAGNEATPWPGLGHERFEREVHDRAAPDSPAWDAFLVTEADTGVIAADDANRIIAVSRPLADALGWDPSELVGRRVVAIVPPALREAHVAGFSRHLSTGEEHIMGTSLELPVLRRDGSEVLCRFLLERAPVRRGRPVYLAWIEPLDEGGSS